MTDPLPLLPARRRLLRLAALLPALALAGCAGLARRDRGDRAVYPLAVAQPPAGPPVSWQLMVDEPQAPALLDRSRLALRRPDGQMAYFADVNWSDRLAALVQLTLLQAFGNSGRIVGLAGDSLSLRADYLLRSELRAFQAAYAVEGQAPEVRVALGAQLIRLPQRVAVAAELFEARVQAERDAMAAITAAFDTAFVDIQLRLVDWTLARGEADYRSRG